MSDYKDIKNKYLKYKKKYFNLKNESMIGGGFKENVEKELPVHTEYGVALLQLYKVGVVINMFPHQVAAYKLYPQDGRGLSNSNDNTDTTKCIQIYTSSKIKNIHINTNI
jgi:hypothetical protein